MGLLDFAKQGDQPGFLQQHSGLLTALGLGLLGGGGAKGGLLGGLTGMKYDQENAKELRTQSALNSFGSTIKDPDQQMLFRSDPTSYLKHQIDAVPLTPEQEQQKIRIAQAGASSTNIDMKAEGASEKARGEGLGKRFNDLAADGSEAAKDMATIQRLDQLGKTVEPGARTNLLNNIRMTTGLTLDQNADNVQAYQSALDYLTPRMRVSGSGSSSDKDVALFKGSLPSLLGTPEGNKLVTETMGGIAQQRIQASKVAQKWQLGQISAQQAQTELDGLGDPFAAFREFQSKMPPQGQQAPQQPQPARAGAINNIPFKVLP